MCQTDSSCRIGQNTTMTRKYYGGTRSDLHFGAISCRQAGERNIIHVHYPTLLEDVGMGDALVPNTPNSTLYILFY